MDASLDNPITCPLCFIEFPGDADEDEELYALKGCGHALCSSCWQGFLNDAVQRKGYFCANLTCPIGMSPFHDPKSSPTLS